jgi:hypothetical protein
MADPLLSYDCPHCRRAVTSHVRTTPVPHSDWGNPPREGGLRAHLAVCSNCGGPFLQLHRLNVAGKDRGVILTWPSAALRLPPPSVPTNIADDYQEAANVLSISPKASAAIGRRLLQLILREHVQTKRRDLADQIDEVLEDHRLPSAIAQSLDAVRNIGNFASHPIKSKQSGEIVPVEAGEAEWTLDVLDLLFDHLFVQPEKARERREALNKKLEAAGKPPMKAPKGADGGTPSGEL